MKKIELKSMAEYFGTFLPAGKIQNRDTRLAIVMLYASLAKPAKEIDEEIDAVRAQLTDGHDEEIRKYAELLSKPETKAEAEAMTECVQIDKDFAEAQAKILSEDINPDIKKVPLAVLYDALCDCGFPRFQPELPLASVEEIFKTVIE